MCIYVWCVLSVCACTCLTLCGGADQRAENGYPMGLMGFCPGSNKPAEIPRSQLKYLLFVVQGKGGTRRAYTYWNAKNIMKDPRINPKRRTMMIALGYLDSTGMPIATTLANWYESKGYNVIIIDNQRFATVHYFLSSRLMRPVGKHVAEVLAQLTKAGLNSSKLELIGFSLGGQTVSYIGRHFQDITGRNISRITALDPSGPCFRTLGADDRLDASNADFVQVIHTNIDGYGMSTRMGHVDFYVNGGEFQPGDINYFICTLTCSHFRVLPIWFSVLRNPNKFIGLKCDSVQQARDAQCYDRYPRETNVMGTKVNTSNHGIFYVATSMLYPYYMGEDGLKAESVYYRIMTNVNDGNETEIFT